MLYICCEKTSHVDESTSLFSETSDIIRPAAVSKQITMWTDCDHGISDLFIIVWPAPENEGLDSDRSEGSDNRLFLIHRVLSAFDAVHCLET